MRAVSATHLDLSFWKSLKALGLLLSFGHHRRRSVEKFEQEFAASEGAAFAVGTSMARIGLYQTLLSLEVKAGDSILVSPFNIPEMLAVIQNLKLKPIFVDLAPDSLFIDLKDLERKAKISSAKILFFTEVAGQIGDLEMLSKICKDHGILRIQDATQAKGSFFVGKPLTSFSDFTIYSTCEFKFIHGFRGGLVLGNDLGQERKLRAVVGQVKAPQGFLFLAVKWFKDSLAASILKPILFQNIFFHLHQRIFTQNPLAPFSTQSLMGSDYSEMQKRIPERMFFYLSDFEANLGRGDLKTVGTRIAHHQKIAAIYRTELKSLLPQSSDRALSSYWRFPILLSSSAEADRVREHLLQSRIVLERTGLSLLSKECIQAQRVIERMLLLPCHTGISEDDARCIVHELRQILAVAQRASYKEELKAKDHG